MIKLGLNVVVGGLYVAWNNYPISAGDLVFVLSIGSNNVFSGMIDVDILSGNKILTCPVVIERQDRYFRAVDSQTEWLEGSHRES